MSRCPTASFTVENSNPADVPVAVGRMTLALLSIHTGVAGLSKAKIALREDTVTGRRLLARLLAPAIRCAQRSKESRTARQIESLAPSIQVEKYLRSICDTPLY
jgi:hypothetical protein